MRISGACPRCDTSTHVSHERGKGNARWYCAACNLAFKGSADEYQAEHDRAARRPTDRLEPHERERAAHELAQVRNTLAGQPQGDAA